MLFFYHEIRDASFDSYLILDVINRWTREGSSVGSKDRVIIEYPLQHWKCIGTPNVVEKKELEGSKIKRGHL